MRTVSVIKDSPDFGGCKHHHHKTSSSKFKETGKPRDPHLVVSHLHLQTLRHTLKLGCLYDFCPSHISKDRSVGRTRANGPQKLTNSKLTRKLVVLLNERKSRGCIALQLRKSRTSCLSTSCPRKENHPVYQAQTKSLVY